MKTFFPDIKNSEIVDLCFLDSDSFIDLPVVFDKVGPKAVKSLKKDLSIAHCLCKFSDAIIVEVLINAGKQSYDLTQNKLEQIFYIYTKDRLLTLGELFWTDYHWFYEPVFSFLRSLEIDSLPANDQALFIGGRDNFTHAFLDYAAALSYATSQLNINSMPIYVGDKTQIQEMAFQSLSINTNNLYDNRFISFNHQLNASLSLKLTRVKDCYAFRHISIFSLVNHTRSRLFANKIDPHTIPDSPQKIYLSRMSTDRVINQNQVVDLVVQAGFSNLNSIHKLSINDRISILRECSYLIVPPGSDNVNAILFAPESCNVIQMMCMSPNKSLYDTRLYYYSSLRYMLPMLNRLNFWIANDVRSNLSGKWSKFEVTSSLTD